MLVEFQNAFLEVVGIRILHVLWRVTSAVGDVVVEDVFRSEGVKTGVADKRYTIVLCSATDQSARVFYPHVVVTPVWPLDEEKVDVMATIAFLADVQRNTTFAIMLMSGFNFSNLGMSFTGMGKLRPDRLSVFRWGR